MFTSLYSLRSRRWRCIQRTFRSIQRCWIAKHITVSVPSCCIVRFPVSWWVSVMIINLRATFIHGKYIWPGHFYCPLGTGFNRMGTPVRTAVDIDVIAYICKETLIFCFEKIYSPSFSIIIISNIFQI